jgi:RNA polymerase sigma-70 factor (ECF subfamily)
MASQMPDPSPEGDGQFLSTDWGIVAAARDRDEPSARKALAELSEAYWYPIYAYIRRRGYPADQAQDLTQDFFTLLLRPGFLSRVSPEKGRFRAFLLACCKNFLSNDRDRRRALKRGGGCLTISIPRAEAEGRYAREPSHNLTAERLFARRWAITLLERVLERLGAEMAGAGKGPLFDRLAPALLGDGTSAPYAELAKDLGMTENAVKMAALRLRQRYRTLVRQEVVDTVDGCVDVDDEIRDLFQALRS